MEGSDTQSVTKETPDDVFKVWIDKVPEGERPCLDVPLAEVRLVVDKIGRQLRTLGIRVNPTYGTVANTKASQKASLRRGTVESLSFTALRDDGAEVWLLREYLRCDRACENCTVTFRLTVYSSSQTTCAIEYRGEHGTRSKELKLRTGVSVINRVRQLLDAGDAKTPGQVQRHLQRALLQEPLPHEEDPAFASPTAPASSRPTGE